MAFRNRLDYRNGGVKTLDDTEPSTPNHADTGTNTGDTEKQYQCEYVCSGKARIPRRRHRHRLPREELARVGRKDI